MIHEAVYSRLKNDAGVSAIVGTRVYPQKASQGVVLPCLVYQRIGTADRFVFHGGTTKTATSRFQVDCWAKTATAALQLSETVVSCLHGWSGQIGGDKIHLAQVVNTVEDFDLETGEYVVPIEVEIFHKENI